MTERGTHKSWIRRALPEHVNQGGCEGPDVYASRFNLIGKYKLRGTRRLSPICLSGVPRRESRPARSRPAVRRTQDV